MSLRERFYSILIVSATDSLLTCSLKQDTTLSILLQVSVLPNKRLLKKHLILLSSTLHYMMMWVFVLRLTLVPQNCPLCYF